MASIKDLKKMCDFYPHCSGCPINSILTCSVHSLPDSIEEIVDKWVAEHPVKTYAMDFFDKFPNAPRDRDGAPKTCWRHVYGDGKYCAYDACTECWNREMIENDDR